MDIDDAIRILREGANGRWLLKFVSRIAHSNLEPDRFILTNDGDLLIHGTLSDRQARAAFDFLLDVAIESPQLLAARLP